MAVENKNALQNGTILKHGGTEYRIERFLGSGGFGITYLVFGVRKKAGEVSSQLYAVKEHFMSQDCERDSDSHAVVCSKPAKERVDEGRKDFIAEANRLKNNIRHSHIVSVNDVFEANKTAYYVMEFLDGKSLRSYIRKNGACKEEEAVLLLLPIARAVGYLHDQRITHLDIKPDNIMIVEKENGKICPVLIDFGLSKHYDKKGKPTSTIRVQATSDGYSPMEQYLGISDFQPTADVYALAATLAYCLTAKDPKRAADIRPGEMRLLLEDKVSDSRLSALLKALSPSKYERTESIRTFLTELCPNEDLSSWDTETDNNITDPIFFRKKKKGSFLSSLMELFGKKTKTKRPDKNIGSDDTLPKLLIPDYSMFIEIRQPKEFGLSKKVWFCQDVCNTVYSYYGDEHIGEDDFFGGLPQDVIAALEKFDLLSPEHWEDDFITSTSDGARCKYVSILFCYKDGTKFERINSGVLGSSRLLSAAEAILNCDSISEIIFGKDKVLIKNAQSLKDSNEAKSTTTTPVPDKEAGKPISSFMIGLYKGMMTEIDIQDWRRLNENEKESFTPRFVYFKLEDYACVKGQTLGLAVKEQLLSNNTDIESAIASYSESLNPSGICGYEQGACHIPNMEEARLLEYYHERINITLQEWGLQPFTNIFFINKNGKKVLSSNDSRHTEGFNVGLRLVVDYWATRAVFRHNVAYELKGVHVLTFDKIQDNQFVASLYHIPQIRESVEIDNELKLDLRSVVLQLKDIKTSHWPADDETPIELFWRHLKSTYSFILVGNAKEFIHAQLLQYQLGASRIFNPSVLNALWQIVSLNSDKLKSSRETLLDYAYECYTCLCSISDSIVEVRNIQSFNTDVSETNTDGVIKGGIIVNQILQRKLSDLLLLDMIEFDISLGVVSDGLMRDYRTITRKSTIPSRNTDEIPFDLIKNSEIYLHIGNERISIDLNPYFGEITSDVAKLTVDIDANKRISLSFGDDNNFISLGQILSDCNYSIE